MEQVPLRIAHYNPFRGAEYRISSIKNKLIRNLDRREKELRKDISAYHVGEMNYYALENRLDEIARFRKEVESAINVDAILNSQTTT